MANVEAIPGYLAATFPSLPAEIKDYVASILKENVDDLRTLEDVVEAVGDHIQSYVEELHNDGVNKTCMELLQLMHGENLPEAKKFGATTKKLDQAVDMAAENHNFSEMESIWKLQARDMPTTVDKKKLGKAENRAAVKAEAREAEPVIRKKRPESAATASQAPIKDLGARGMNMKDVKLESVDISIGTKQLLTCADLTMAYGRRYGLVGRNGIGKTTLLSMISSGQLRIPSGISMLSVEQEVTGDDTRVIDAVLSSDSRRQQMIDREHVLQARLNKENLTEAEKNKWNDELSKLYVEMETLQLDKAPARAASILYGLGFTPDEQKKPTREFSGGWRMRVALARALFVKPDLLLLDEPTNMLDMRAVYWLEGHLQSWEGTILTVSHDRKFLNEICTDIVHLHTRRLDHYKGNYDSFEKTMKEKLTQQAREYEAQQTLRQHTQEFIDKFRYNAKRAPMVQSRIKMLEKLPVIQPVELDAEITFKFPECEVLNNPVLQLDDVSFRYNDKTAYLFKRLNLGTHANSRICIVGENGSGKTTLLKLLLGDLNPTMGLRNINRRIRIGYFTQHHVDQLDMDMTAIEVLAHNHPGKTQEEYRTALSRFGLSGDMALQSVFTLSGGQKSRLAFANIAMLNPNYLILDEPTNHLDVETVAALGVALNTFAVSSSRSVALYLIL